MPGPKKKALALYLEAKISMVVWVRKRVDTDHATVVKTFVGPALTRLNGVDSHDDVNFGDSFVQYLEKERERGGYKGGVFWDGTKFWGTCTPSVTVIAENHGERVTNPPITNIPQRPTSEEALHGSYIGKVREAIDSLEPPDILSVLIKSTDEASKRQCRAIAVEICLACNYDPKYLAVLWVRSPEDLKALVDSMELAISRIASGRQRVLVWLDDEDDIPATELAKAVADIRARLLREGSTRNQIIVKQVFVGSFDVGIGPYFTIDIPAGEDCQLGNFGPGTDDAVYGNVIRLERTDTGNGEAILDACKGRAQMSAIVENLQKCLNAEIVAIYSDDDDAKQSVFVRVCITSLDQLNDLRDAILFNKLELRHESGAIYRVDMTHFARIFDWSLRQFTKLSQHQRSMLGGAYYSRPEMIVFGVPGSGKTFVAIDRIVHTLEKPGGYVLFVAPNKPLVNFVVSWLFERLNRSEANTVAEKITGRLRVLVEPFQDGPCAVEFDCKERVKLKIKRDQVARFSVAIVDEAHHIVCDNIAKRHLWNALKNLEYDHLLLLADTAQQPLVTRNDIVDFVQDLRGRKSTVVPTAELKISLRSTDQITRGIAKYRADNDDVVCLISRPGVPLGFSIFNADGLLHLKEMQKYADLVTEAVSQIAGKFNGLSLHNRLAIIVPNKSFRDEFEKYLSPRLLDLKKQYKLVHAGDIPIARSNTNESQHVVFDSVDEMNGLERLFVFSTEFCVDLDHNLYRQGGSESAKEALNTVSLIYRGLSRAHLVAVIINKYVQGGFTQHLCMVDYRPCDAPPTGSSWDSARQPGDEYTEASKSQLQALRALAGVGQYVISRSGQQSLPHRGSFDKKPRNCLLVIIRSLKMRSDWCSTTAALNIRHNKENILQDGDALVGAGVSPAAYFQTSTERVSSANWESWNHLGDDVRANDRAILAFCPFPPHHLELPPAVTGKTKLDDVTQRNDLKLSGQGDKRFVRTKKFCEAIAKNAELQRLDLTGTQIGPDRLIELLLALQKTLRSTLRSLVLEDCLVNDKAIEHLARIFETKNCSLTSLQLQNNKVTSTGALRFSTALEGNEKLITLNLNDNHLHEPSSNNAAVKCILNLLKIKLVNLHLRGNSIYLSEVDISSITSALLDPNNVLQNLDLPEVHSSSALREHILKKGKKNFSLNGVNFRNYDQNIANTKRAKTK